MNRISTVKLSKVALLATIAFVLTIFSLPLPFFPSFLKIDLSELPVIVGAFAFGPIYAVVIEGIKNILGFLMNNSGTGGVGEVANFLSGCAFVVPPAIIFKYRKNKISVNNKSNQVIIPMILGVISVTIIASVLNYFIFLPIYATLFGGMDVLMAVSSQVNKNITDLKTLVIIAILPFNILKSTITSIVYIPLHNKLSVLFS